MEQTTLYYRQGASDKVYQASIEPRGDQYIVAFAYGRRGTTLQTGIKTQTPVDMRRRFQTTSRHIPIIWRMGFFRIHMREFVN